MIKGILLDMDGLMFDSERLVFNLLEIKAKEMGLEVGEEVYKNCMGAGRNGLLWMEKNRPDLLKCTLNPEQEIEERNKYYQPGSLNKNGLKELYEYLKANNYKIAIGSNSGLFRVKDYLKFSTIDFDIDAIATGEGKFSPKPDPDIYLYLAKQLNLKPEECLVVEDSGYGAKAGINGGFKTALIEDVAYVDEDTRKSVTYRLNNLYDVIDVLKETDNG